MPDYLKTGLGLLAGGVLFGAFFWANKRAGRAIFSHWGFSDSKATYWFFQTIWALFSVALLISSILVLARVTPP